jgi:hypothetical protein
VLYTPPHQKPPIYPPTPCQKGGSNIRMKVFQKKIFRYFFSKILDPLYLHINNTSIYGYKSPLYITPLHKTPFSKHEPLFILKPFFKKISGEFFIPKFRTLFSNYLYVNQKPCSSTSQRSFQNYQSVSVCLPLYSYCSPSPSSAWGQRLSIH